MRLTTHTPKRSRTLAARWAKLRTLRAEEKRVGIVLANYPTKTSRIGNGVGLDTPASVGQVSWCDGRLRLRRWRCPALL
jgi:hypothetical protein